MNFDNMPELHYQWGYFFVLGLMAVVVFGLYRGFRKSGWL
jgi:magnesium transporter